jgi:hypothetical protein
MAQALPNPGHAGLHARDSGVLCQLVLSRACGTWVRALPCTRVHVSPPCSGVTHPAVKVSLLRARCCALAADAVPPRGGEYCCSSHDVPAGLRHGGSDGVEVTLSGACSARAARLALHVCACPTLDPPPLLYSLAAPHVAHHRCPSGACAASPRTQVLRRRGSRRRERRR